MPLRPGEIRAWVPFPCFSQGNGNFCRRHLTICRTCGIIICVPAGVAQLVEQRIRNAQVIGSSPITSSMEKPRCASCVRGFFAYAFPSRRAITRAALPGSPVQSRTASDAIWQKNRENCQISLPRGGPGLTTGRKSCILSKNRMGRSLSGWNSVPSEADRDSALGICTEAADDGTRLEQGKAGGSLPLSCGYNQEKSLEYHEGIAEFRRMLQYLFLFAGLFPAGPKEEPR